jgi:hypothetical protein
MSRKAGALTVAIRSICDEKGFDVVYNDARPILTAMGFEMADEPDPKFDDDVKQFNDKFEHTFGKIGRREESSDPEKVAQHRLKVAQRLGWADHKIKNVLREVERRAEYKAERQGYDVTKTQWKKSRASGHPSTSTKPTAAVTNKGVAAKDAEGIISLPPPKQVPAGTAPRRRGRPRKMQQPPQQMPLTDDTLKEQMAALAAVTAMGGEAAVKDKVAALLEEAERLTEQTKLVEKLRELLDKGAA